MLTASQKGGVEFWEFLKFAVETISRRKSKMG